MKAHVKSPKTMSVIFLYLACLNISYAQVDLKIFYKEPKPIVNNREYRTSPYSSVGLDYHEFIAQKEGDPQVKKSKDWFLHYKQMYNFKCREPFVSGGWEYTKKDYSKSGYIFRLVDNQIIEDSIGFLSSKYSANDADTLKKWMLPPKIWDFTMEDAVKRLGKKHFKFVGVAFNAKKAEYYIDVPEAEKANDEMVIMRLFKYPADVDILLYNFEIENWEYVESVTVSGDHELELYILNKFEPRYLKMCE
jgi:hypothetical protein